MTNDDQLQAIVREIERQHSAPVDAFEDELARRLGLERPPALSKEEWRLHRDRYIEEWRLWDSRCGEGSTEGEDCLMAGKISNERIYEDLQTFHAEFRAFRAEAKAEFKALRLDIGLLQLGLLTIARKFLTHEEVRELQKMILSRDAGS